MNGLGTLSSLVERFTTEEQFMKYEAFLNSKRTDLGASYESLFASMTTAKNNLDWDKKYMTEFMEHLIKLKNSAPEKTISIFASVITFAVLFLLN